MADSCHAFSIFLVCVEALMRVAVNGWPRRVSR